MLPHSQSPSFFHRDRLVKSLPTITMHHVTTAVDMNAPVEVPRGVQRVDFVPGLKHLPAGARHNSRPLDKRSHDYGATIAVDLQVNQTRREFRSKVGYDCRMSGDNSSTQRAVLWKTEMLQGSLKIIKYASSGFSSLQRTSCCS